MISIAIALGLLSGLSPAIGDFVAPHYTLDLDAPPETRWRASMRGQIALHGWEHTYQPILDYIDTIFPKETWSKYDAELRSVAEPIIGAETVAEINGMREVAIELGHNVTMSELEFFQIFYEILMQCTGVLARDGDGNILHGRNMDIGLPVQNLTVQVAWKRGGRKIMESTQYLGYVGVHTGMRLGGWSVQANERLVLTPGPAIGYDNAILLLTAAAFLEGHQPVGQFLRKTLLEHGTLEDALPALLHTKLASPLYLIAGGLSGGKIITRDRMGPARESQDTSVFGRQPVPPGAAELNVSGWFRVQTNWDPWVNETEADCDSRVAKYEKAEEQACEEYIKLVYGDTGSCNDLCGLYSDARAAAATHEVQRLSQQTVSAAGLVNVLSTQPILNNLTKFTSIMSASTDLYTTTVRTVPHSTTAPSEEATAGVRFLIRKLVPALRE